jgi:TolA-binding protein
MSSDVNDISSSWFEFLAWIETNRRNLMWAGVSGLIIVFAVVAYRWKTHQAEADASEALLRLRPTVSSAAPSEAAATAADYLKLAQEYPRTAAAERARLLAAGTLFADGKFAEAQVEFERLLREQGDGLLVPSAAYGVAASLEAQGKKDEALAAYRNVLTRFPKSALTDEAKLALARIYEAKGQPDLAFKTYEEIARPGTVTAASSQAAQRKQQLLAAHPELAKTNAAATITTTAPVISGKTNSAAAIPTNVAPAKP